MLPAIVAQWQQTCHQQAECDDSLANTATSHTGRAWHVVLALLCGFEIAIVIGYASHRLLEATTPRSLALLF